MTLGDEDHVAVVQRDVCGQVAVDELREIDVARVAVVLDDADVLDVGPFGWAAG
jgi:hypothetical protein